MLLSPITHHGKNKIHEAGTNTWKIIRTVAGRDIFCLKGNPGFLIEPVCRKAGHLRRWVRRSGDPDFTLLLEEGEE